MSNEKTGSAPIEQQQVFIAPEKFVYANALRLYGTGPEVFIEFGRSILPTLGQPQTAKGEIGVILSLQAAGSLVGQLQQTLAAQLAFLQDQTEKLNAKLKATQGEGTPDGG